MKLRLLAWSTPILMCLNYVFGRELLTGRPLVLTFLSLMEYRRAWMVDTRLIWIGELLAAPFMNTLLSHLKKK